MLILHESAVGFALLKVLDNGLLKNVDSIEKSLQDDIAEKIQLSAFSKFKDMAEAADAAESCLHGKLHKTLKKFLKKNIVKKKIPDELAVADKALGACINKSLKIKCVNNAKTLELFRGLRGQASQMIDLKENQDHAMKLGLSHYLSRHKLKFSADKVDTMVVQAISLLDELDKEINTYSMRVKEWYGWHFPEMSKLITENLKYAQVVQKCRYRKNFKDMDLSDILDEQLEETVKKWADRSMGTDMTDEDMKNIVALAGEVLGFWDYRQELFTYLKNRMNAIAPNLTHMLGELVGARLIAHSGSLLNLAKLPASTIQILGAEKALFRALKTKSHTPKYGLIYHASLVGKCTPKNKGKISRVLAAKTALSIRVDALTEGKLEGPTVALEQRVKVEKRIFQLEGKTVTRGEPNVLPDKKKHKASSKAKTYNDAADFTETPGAPDTEVKVEVKDEEMAEPDKKKKKKKKKDKKKKKSKAAEPEVKEEKTEEAEKKKKKKKKKKRKREGEDGGPAAKKAKSA